MFSGVAERENGLKCFKRYVVLFRYNIQSQLDILSKDGIFYLQETTQTEVTNQCGKIYSLQVLYGIITTEGDVRENVGKPNKKKIKYDSQ